MPFSALVRDAHAMGFTEPDPREDLSGQDVARKLLILGRQIGLTMDLDEVKVDSLVPKPLARGQYTQRVPAGVRALRRRDGRAREARRGARQRAALRRHARARQGDAPASRNIRARTRSPSAKGSDNVIAFTTKRYARTPLVVQGPGAGADVTAMGVFSDILKLLHYLPR